MRDEKLLKILVLVIALTFSACQKSADENDNSTLPQSSPSVSPTLDLSPTPVRYLETPKEKLFSSIRKVDFSNFTYSFPTNPSETFTLKNGKKEQTENEDGAVLQKTEYGDITSDGNEEAMVSILPVTDGNCQCEMVFIYTLENKKSKLLWSFDTGDRAEGGLKKVYAENGELVLELFGDDKFENGEWKYDIAEGKFNGLCCPTTFTKFRFKWNGKKFVVEGKPELFDYDWRKEMNTKQ